MAKAPDKSRPPRRRTPPVAPRRKRSTTGKVIGAGLAVATAGGMGTALHNESVKSPTATCGGSLLHRWPVKVATDDDARAHKLALDPGDQVFRVSDLNQVRPQPLDAPDGRMDVEKKAYRVHGYLSYFTIENGKDGDQDYHVVIADTPGHYTSGKEPATGDSMVVEFPNPACLGGKVGSRTPSTLGPRISEARSTFVGNLHGISKDVRLTRSIPVTVTGIGFFDEANSNHLPTGHAKIWPDAKGKPVVLELHPVTQVVFGDDGEVD